MVSRIFIFHFLRLLAAVLLLGGITATAGEVSVELSSETVPAGEGVQLSLEITGQVTNIEIPQVPDLIVQGRGRSSQTSIINGAVSSSTTFTYAVGSQKPGEYTIPAIAVTVDGQVIRTEPRKLKVTPSANQDPQGMTQGGTGGNPSAAQQQATGDDQLGFLTVELAASERKHIWVGEIAPVRIKAFLSAEARVRLSSNIQPEGSAFTLHNISDRPQQNREVHNGRQYLVVTWFGGLSATKPGTYPPDLRIKASMQVRDPDALVDPRAAFFGRVPMIEKEVVLSSSKDANALIEVKELPSEGKPENFSGAVGKFVLEQYQIPSAWHTAEPQQITAVIGGEGNFNLLRQPDLVPAGDWKTYEGQSTFAAKDVASFSGSQTFRFNALTRKAGDREVNLALAFFNPETGRYTTISSPPQRVTVAGKDVPEVVAAPESAKPPADPMLPIRKTDSGSGNLVPLFQRPDFAPLLACCGAAALAGVLLPLVLRRLRDPARKAQAAAQQALATSLQEAGSHAARGDVPGFFTAARRALQVQLGAQWGRQPHAIALEDVSGRLPPDSPVVRLFAEADRRIYLPAAGEPENLTPWRSLLQAALESVRIREPETGK